MFSAHKKRLIAAFAIFSTLTGFAIYRSRTLFPLGNIRRINTIFGTCDISDPVVQKLLSHKIMQRLKKVDQHGPPTYFLNRPTFSRYDHSVGVYHLLKKMNLSLREQVAGLLHDASHTAGSHVADHLFKTGYNDSYQDNIHEWFLDRMDIEESILKPHSLSNEEIIPHSGEFHGLEQGLPDMCADRIQYNLHTGLVYERISQAECDKIVNDLRFENKKWFFICPNSARKFADLSVHFTEHFWGSAENIALNHWLSLALQRALDLKLITFDELHFGVDDTMLAALHSSSDPVITETLKKLQNPSQHFSLTTKDLCSESNKNILYAQPKCRGIDPLVKVDGTFHRLSDLDKEFKSNIERVRDAMQQGHTIVLH